ncbi:hypothetical protein C8R44DRAFT_885672 [Mycena epipterygia]|nr:hypothetical protein C8R44DRAFT_885672 [Mycena epipterygia]
MSALAAGHGSAIYLEDLGLKKSFTLPSAGAGVTLYNDIMVNPGLSFIHSYPGVMRSGLRASDSSWIKASDVLMPLLTPFSYSVEASGEHQLYSLLKAGPGALRTNDKGDDIGLVKAYHGGADAMSRLWKHTEEATAV